MRRFTLTSLTVLSALGLYLTSGSSLALGAAVLLTVLGLVGERLEIPPRVLTVLVVLSLIGPFLIQLPIPKASGFLFEPALSLAGGLFACFGSAVLLVRINRGWEEQLLMVTSTLTLLVAGNTTQALPLAYAVGAFTLFLVLYLRAMSFGLKKSTAGSSLIALLFALGLAIAMSWSEAGFNNFFFSMQSWSASVNFGDIAGIQPQSGPGGMKVLVRVFSDDPENYLAARRYVKYEGRKWKGSQTRPIRLEQYDGAKGYFLRGAVENEQSLERRDRIEITTLNPDALLAPLNTRFVAVELDHASLSWCGDLTVKDSGASFNGSYEVFMGDNPVGEERRYLDQCLEVKVAPEVAALAHQIAGVGPAEVKVFKLVKYFQENFDYGFGYPFDLAEDPVAEFLKEKPAAHCEVFATCLTLMCREVGVPARYV
ncbi:MAG: transglutaminase domain-containing protein, partial [Candidatus Eremiobacteraeota bacterium]|nr:transglutaminase domain-containing protein [Candidatus Eremiobacteraeota bacterium]